MDHGPSAGRKDAMNVERGEKQTLTHNAERKPAASSGSCLGRGLQLTAGQVNPREGAGEGCEKPPQVAAVGVFQL